MEAKTGGTTRILSPNESATLAADDDLIDRERIVLRNNLRLFVKKAWPVIEPSTTYLENWHIDLIAEHLEGVTFGHIRRLLINLPPRYAKSIVYR